MILKANNNIIYKVLLILLNSCLILNANPAKSFVFGARSSKFNTRGSSSSFSTGSSWGSGSSRIGASIGSHHFAINSPKFGNGFGDRSGSVKPYNAVAYTSPFSNIRVQPLKKPFINTKPLKSTNYDASPALTRQPAYNPFYKSETKPLKSTNYDASPALTRQPAYNPFYKSETKPLISTNYDVSPALTRQPAYNPFYKTETSVTPSLYSTNSGFSASNNYADSYPLNQVNHVPDKKFLSGLTNLLKGSLHKSSTVKPATKIESFHTAIPTMPKTVTNFQTNLKVTPVDFINSYPRFNALKVDHLATNDKKPCKNGYKYAKTLQSPFKKLSGHPSLLGLRGNTVPTEYHRNLLESQQLDGGFLNKNPNFPHPLTILVICTAILIVLTTGTVLFKMVM